MSDLEEKLHTQLIAAGLPEPERELKFCQTRRWRFDFAYPVVGMAIEVEGGIFSRGGHTRGAGYRANCEKYNTATLLGWRVLRYTDREINNGEAAKEIYNAYEHWISEEGQ